MVYSFLWGIAAPAAENFFSNAIQPRSVSGCGGTINGSGPAAAGFELGLPDHIP